MLKKTFGKILLRKSNAEKHVIASAERQSEKVLSTKETLKNSTTSVSTVVEVWIMLGLLLSLGTLTESVNQKDRKGKTNE